MSRRALTNLSASVRQRLLNLSRKQGEDFSYVLSRYANERLLYRLSCSPYAHDFILKGAMLFAVWQGEMHRPTRDLDLLSFGNPAEERLTSIFKALCVVTCEPDGLIFDPGSVRVASIRQGQIYGGLRVELQARLAQAKIALQIDVGFGDAVVPQPVDATFPAMLDFPPPRLRVYSRESVVAEKLHAMVVLGMLNSRMKDFYDLWVLRNAFAFDGTVLQKAIKATFGHRQTPIPGEIPIALTEQFSTDGGKNQQWLAFLRRHRLAAETGAVSLAHVVNELSAFLIPVLRSLQQDTLLSLYWRPGGPWSEIP